MKRGRATCHVVCGSPIQRSGIQPSQDEHRMRSRRRGCTLGGCSRSLLHAWPGSMPSRAASWREASEPWRAFFKVERGDATKNPTRRVSPERIVGAMHASQDRETRAAAAGDPAVTRRVLNGPRGRGVTRRDGGVAPVPLTREVADGGRIERGPVGAGFKPAPTPGQRARAVRSMCKDQASSAHFVGAMHASPLRRTEMPPGPRQAMDAGRRRLAKGGRRGSNPPAIGVEGGGPRGCLRRSPNG